MLPIAIIAVAAGLVLGLRFSLITLALLILATTIIFAIGVWGGGSPLVVALQLLATSYFRTDQLSRWQPACCTSSRAREGTLQPHGNAIFAWLIRASGDALIGRWDKMLKSKPLMQTGIFERIVVGIPRVAKAMEDLPVEQLWPVLGAVEGSYRRTLTQYGFSTSDCHVVTSAIMRRLKGQLVADGLTEKEMMTRLCEELGVLDDVVAAAG